MMNPTRTLSVFVASPGDCAIEQRAIRDVIDEINRGFAARASTRLELLGWEEPLSTGCCNHRSITSELIDRCDCFLMILSRQWEEEHTDSSFTSHTAKAFHRAMDRFKKTGTPRAFVLLKAINAESRADPGPQLSRVLRFRRQLEDSSPELYGEFRNTEEFRQLVAPYLRGLVKDRLPVVTPESRRMIIPTAALEGVARADEETARTLARLETAQATEASERERETILRRRRDIQLTQKATRAAREGRLEEARQGFAAVTRLTTDAAILSLCFHFYYRTSEHDTAEELAHRLLAIDGARAISEHSATACRLLRLLRLTRGDYDAAEELCTESIRINEQLDGPSYTEELAGDYCLLGDLRKRRGDLKEAEELWAKSHDLFKQIGTPYVTNAIQARIKRLEHSQKERGAT